MKQLLEAGVHFGHQTRRWNPKMAEYIFAERNGIYIIDLQKTVKKVDEAYNFVRDLAADGGEILFVGTKKQAAESLKEEAEREEEELKEIQVQLEKEKKKKDCMQRAIKEKTEAGAVVLSTTEAEKEIKKMKEKVQAEIKIKRDEIQQKIKQINQYHNQNPPIHFIKNKTTFKKLKLTKLT